MLTRKKKKIGVARIFEGAEMYEGFEGDSIVCIQFLNKTLQFNI